MTGSGHDEAIGLMETVAAELAEIRRAKHFSIWRSEASLRLQGALAEVEPFRDYRHVLIYTGDGGRVVSGADFGAWAIGRMVGGETPEAILAAFAVEAASDSTTYSEVSPVLGAELDETCDLSDGLTLAPEPTDAYAALLDRAMLRLPALPGSPPLLRQSFSVSPGFRRRESDAPLREDACTTTPNAGQRGLARRRVRLACLLACPGGIEIPLSVQRPTQGALFAAGSENRAMQPSILHPTGSFPVEAAAVKRAFDRLGAFRKPESLERAIERLGRSRRASSPVDKAVELGIAAEIALMHDQSPTNTEIAHKIGGRAAWLLGRDPIEREAVYAGMKDLYHARSKAVHSGVLSTKSEVDLAAADRLVARALSAILERGAFPRWNNLTMGGSG